MARPAKASGLARTRLGCSPRTWANLRRGFEEARDDEVVPALAQQIAEGEI